MAAACCIVDAQVCTIPCSLAAFDGEGGGYLSEVTGLSSAQLMQDAGSAAAA